MTTGQNSRDDERCTALTKKGYRCTINADPGFTECHIHRSRPDLDTRLAARPRCTALTRRGRRCSCVVERDGLCLQHARVQDDGRYLPRWTD